MSKASRNGPEPARTLNEIPGDIGEFRSKSSREKLKGSVDKDMRLMNAEETGDKFSKRDDESLENQGTDEKDGAHDGYDEDEDDEDSGCSENNPNHEFKWLEPIDVEVVSTLTLDQSGKPKTIAFCLAKLIRREQIHDDF